MKKVLVAFLLISSTVLANYRAQGDCYQGGQVVVTNGVSSSTLVEQSFPGCVVTVYPTGSNTPVASNQIFSDNMGTVLGNPFVANQNSHWFFYAANGRYDVQISGGGLPAPITFGDIPLQDPGSPGPTIPTPSSQLTYLRTQPNVGNNTTLQWNPFPTYYATDYNFPSQSPGGSLTGGITNTITLTPVPLGINATDIAHYVYISGGTGAAESCLITGGSATSGASTGTITCTPSNNHTGAWTITSATGGIQEAVCSLGTSGGEVWATAAVTLQSNVATCSKTNVNVTQFAIAITGSFAILGSSPSSTSDVQRYTQSTSNSLTQMETIYDSGPANWATLSGGVRASLRVSVNNSPILAEFQGSATPAVVGVDGAVNGASTLGSGAAIGVIGTAVTNSANGAGGTPAVGVYGQGYIGVQASGGNATQAWGANFVTSNCFPSSGSVCTDGQGFNLNNNYGIEVDANMYKTAGSVAANNIIGVWVTGGSTHQPLGAADAIAVGYLGAFSSIQWKNDISLRDGSASSAAITIGTTAAGNNHGSMSILFNGRDSGGTVRAGSILADSGGNLVLRPGSGAFTALEDSGANSALGIIPNGTTPYVQINNNLTMGASGTVVIPAIESMTGQRYVCITTTGQLVSSASACSGT